MQSLICCSLSSNILLCFILAISIFRYATLIIMTLSPNLYIIILVLSLHFTELFTFSTNFVELCTSFANFVKLYNCSSTLPSYFPRLVRLFNYRRPNSPPNLFFFWALYSQFWLPMLLGCVADLSLLLGFLVEFSLCPTFSLLLRLNSASISWAPTSLAQLENNSA